tara:strand:+ start:1152 stop:1394 length:243 start_codon:yes stop_codon:yes gene_type:complete
MKPHTEHVFDEFGICFECDKQSDSNIKIKEHIQTHHNGNTSAFARTQDVSEVQARRWLKRNCVVIDGTVYCEVSKKKAVK